MGVCEWLFDPVVDWRTLRDVPFPSDSWDWLKFNLIDTQKDHVVKDNEWTTAPLLFTLCYFKVKLEVCLPPQMAALLLEEKVALAERSQKNQEVLVLHQEEAKELEDLVQKKQRIIQKTEEKMKTAKKLQVR